VRFRGWCLISAVGAFELARETLGDSGGRVCLFQASLENPCNAFWLVQSHSKLMFKNIGLMEQYQSEHPVNSFHQNLRHLRRHSFYTNR
jgi:hypothetical protein